MPTPERSGWSTARVWAVAALAYLLVGAIVLWPSLRPGRSILAADLITASSPYYERAGGLAAHNALLSDAAFQFAPWLEFLGDELSAGRVPRWNPWILGGTQVTPNGWISAYYPPFWVATWMDVFDAYNLLVLAHLVWAALGIFALARSVGANDSAAWIAGLIAFIAQFWVHWSLHLSNLVAFSWFPWVLFGAHRLVLRPSGRVVAAFGASFGLWWLGANPQYAYYGTLALVGFAVALLLVRRRQLGRFDRRAIAALVAGPVLGAALAAPLLFPLVSLQDDIVRDTESVEDVAGSHLPPDHILRLVVPTEEGSVVDGAYPGDYKGEWEMDSPFLGVTVLPIMALAVAGRSGGVRLVLLSAVVAVAVLAFAPWLHELLYRVIPGYDRFRVSARWLALLPAFVAPLVALGLGQIRSGGRVVVPVAITVGVACIAIGLAWATTGIDAAFDSVRVRQSVVAAVPLAAVVLALAVRARWPVVAVAIVGASIVGETIAHTTRWFPSVDQARAYRSVPALGVARAEEGRMIRVHPERDQFYPLAANLPMAFGVEDAQGTAVFFPRDYSRFVRLIDDSGVFIRRYNTAPALEDGSLVASPLVAALDVRTVIALPEVEMPADLPPLQRGTVIVYRSPSPGRAIIMPDARPAGETEMWRGIADPEWNPAERSYVDGLPGRLRGGGQILGMRGEGTSEVWEVDAPTGGFLRISSRYHEGWRAEIDGSPAEVYRADGIFRGVALPPGRHRVEFVFRNPPEEWGRLVGAAALVTIMVLGLAGVGVVRPRRRRAGGAGSDGC